jgi:hypothetical protein
MGRSLGHENVPMRRSATSSSINERSSPEASRAHPCVRRVFRGHTPARALREQKNTMRERADTMREAVAHCTSGKIQCASRPLHCTSGPIQCASPSRIARAGHYNARAAHSNARARRSCLQARRNDSERQFLPRGGLVHNARRRVLLSIRSRSIQACRHSSRGPAYSLACPSFSGSP